MTKDNCLVGVVLLVFGLTSFIFSQDNIANNDEELRELDKTVVTARRKAESVADVPASIQILDSSVIEKKKIREGSDIATMTPGFDFTKAIGSGVAVKVRGLVIPAVGAATTSGTQSKINGHSVNSTLFGGVGYLDPSRMEILEGPQGTLYGRNATHGVVNLISARPGEGNYVNITVGQDNYMTVNLAYDHIFNDTFSSRIAISKHNKDGTITNRFNNSDIDSRDALGARISLDWIINAEHVLEMNVDHYKTDDSRMNMGSVFCKRSDFFGCSPYEIGNINEPYHSKGTISSLYDTITLINPAPIRDSDYDAYGGATALPSIDEVNKDVSPKHEMDGTLFQLNHTWQLTDSIEIRNKYSYLSRKYGHLEDNDHSATTTGFTDNLGQPISISGLEYQCLNRTDTFSNNQTVECSDAEDDTHQFELNFISDFEGKHNFTSGLYYFTSEGTNLYTIQTSSYALARSFSNHPLAQEGGLFHNKGLDQLGGTNFYFTLYTQYLTNLATLANPATSDAKATEIAGTLIGMAAAPGVDFSKNMPVQTGGSFTDQRYEFDDVALYGEYYYDLTDITELTVGLRYMNNSYKSKSLVGLLDQAHDSTATDYKTFFDEMAVDSNEDSEHLIYKLALNRKFDYGSVYTSYTTGLRSAGTDPNGAKFDAEESKVFELGHKSSFLDGKLTIFNTFFQNNTDNAPYSTIRFTTSVTELQDLSVTGLTGMLNYQLFEKTNINIGFLALNSKLKGSNNKSDPGNPNQATRILTTVTTEEERSEYRVINPLTNSSTDATAEDNKDLIKADLIANGLVEAADAEAFLTNFIAECAATYGSQGATYCDQATYVISDKGLMANPLGDVFVGAANVVVPDLKDNKVPFTPDFDMTIALTQLFDVPKGVLDATLSYTYKGEFYSDIWNNDRYKVPEQTYMDLVLGYQPEGKRWSLSLWGKNLQDKRYLTVYQRSSNLQGGANFATFRQGITFGFDFNINF